jgi:hypothetical protein
VTTNGGSQVSATRGHCGRGLAGLLGLIWLLGGFRPALPVGPAYAVGEPVELQRWTIAVHRAGHVDTSLSDLEIDPSVRVWLTITQMIEFSR